MIAYIIFIFLAIIAILRYVPGLRIPNSSPWLLPAGFVIKVSVGMFFLYIYSYHYGVGELTADPSAFMVESKILNATFYESPSAYLRFLTGLDNKELVVQYLSETTQWDAGSSKYFNDTRNLLRLHSLIHFISFNQTAIHLFVVSFISLLGLRFMTLAVIPYTQLKTTIVFLALLLMPNALFWSSGLLKEPLIFFSIGLFIYSVLSAHSFPKKLVLIILSIACLAGIKPYILLCIIPAVVIFVLFQYLKHIRTAFIITIVLITGVFLSLLTPPLHPVVKKLSDQQFDFVNIGKGGVFARADTCIYIIAGEDMPHVIVNHTDSTVILTQEIVGDYILPNAKKDKKRCMIQPNEIPWKMYYDGEFSGSYIEITPIEQSGTQLLKNIPEAITNVAIRPYPNDPPASVFKYFSLIDGWGLYLLLIATLLFFRREINRKELSIIVALFVFSLILALLIGWTTPVLGDIIRYKVPIQLAMIVVTLIVFNPKRLKNE